MKARRLQVGDKLIVANGPFRWAGIVIAWHDNERTGPYYVAEVFSKKLGWRPRVVTGPWGTDRCFSLDGGGVVYLAKTAPAWVRRVPGVVRR